MAIDELFTPGTVPNNHEIWPDCLEISFASLQAPAPGVQDDGAKSWSPKRRLGAPPILRCSGINRSRQFIVSD